MVVQRAHSLLRIQRRPRKEDINRFAVLQHLPGDSGDGPRAPSTSAALPTEGRQPLGVQRASTTFDRLLASARIRDQGLWLNSAAPV